MPWTLTRDHLDKRRYTGSTKLGCGAMPIDAPETKFRLYDDDDILYFSGRITLDDLNGPDHLAFAPLDWARAYAGCTRMDYLDPDTDEWRTL